MAQVARFQGIEPVRHAFCHVLAYSEILPVCTAAALLLLLSGVLNTPSRRRRVAAFSCVGLTFTTPWFLPVDATLPRGLCAGAAILAVFRNLDIAGDRGPWPPLRRAVHVILLLDSREISRVPSRWLTSTWLRALTWAATSAFAAWLLSEPLPEERADAALLYWLGALLWTYSSIEATTALTIAAFQAGGFRLPPLHRNPILARTLAEFWARRWNLTVHRMLHRYFYRPVAARFGPNQGVLVAFAASSLLHFWLFLPVVGLASATSAAAFFLVHGALVLLERTLAAHRWRLLAQHLWTVTNLVVTAPLIVGPLVQVVFAP